MNTNQFITLRADENQARGIGRYALDMLGGRYPGPSEAVLARTEQFHLDSVACGVSALALGANAPDRAAARSAGVRHAGRGADVRFDGSRRSREGGAGLFVGRAGVGRQRHQLRLQPGPRRDGRRVRPQRFLPGGRGGGPVGRLRRPPDAPGDDRARRDPRPAGRGVRLEESQDRPRAPRSDRLGGRLRRGARRHGRPDRVGDRPGRGALHAIPRDPGRAPAFRLQGRLGGDQCRSGRAGDAAGDARLRRPGRRLSQPASRLLPRSSRQRTRKPARSI